MATDPQDLCVAILAKDKGYCLYFFLRCLYNQTFPKNRIHLYIRTNDNNDNTKEILDNWLEQHASEYASVHYDHSSINEELKKYNEHEWNSLRFKTLGAIRQASVDYARERGLHYFVADCDNFFIPETLEDAFQNRHLGVIGPALESVTRYGNLHHCICPNGYFKDCREEYDSIRFNRIRGLIECGVIHCTYLIPYWALGAVCYDDNSGRYEYVIVSDSFRKAGIAQIYDNRKNFGFLFNRDNINDSLNDLAEIWTMKYPGLF